jgi:hypothetical protein
MIIENYKHEDLIRNDSKRKMELDVYLSDKQLAFEYQGEQHYYDIYTLGNRWVQMQIDEEKRQACKEKGITLIEIPYWWDFSKSSLITTIYHQRPDLIPYCGDGQPIPIESPKGNRIGDLLKDYFNFILFFSFFIEKKYLLF